MAQKMKMISWDDGLKARALFVLAASHYRRASELECALSSLLDLEDERYCGHLSDAMVDGDSGFDTALKKSGFTIAAQKRRSK